MCIVSAILLIHEFVIPYATSWSIIDTYAFVIKYFRLQTSYGRGEFQQIITMQIWMYMLGKKYICGKVVVHSNALYIH